VSAIGKLTCFNVRYELTFCTALATKVEEEGGGFEEVFLKHVLVPFFIGVTTVYQRFEFLSSYFCNYFQLFLEHLYNNDMAKNIKLTCNLTGDFRYVSEELYEKLAKQYGSV
jgi:hypothetical protein